MGSHAFTSTGGVIHAEVKSENADVIFLVEDIGESIPPEYFDRIFEKFGIVESSKGPHSSESEAGKGSAFSFTSPTLKMLE